MGNTSSCACKASSQGRRISNDHDGLMNFNDRKRRPRNKNHNHVLKLRNESYYHKHKPGHGLHKKNGGKIYKCSGCKVKGFGPHYSCKNFECTLNLHKDCYAPRIVQENRFYHGSDFVFCPSPSEASVEPCNECRNNKRRKCAHRGRYCNACGMDIDGYFYRADGYDLHPCCINLPHKIRCAESGATMELKSRSKYKCDSCGKKKVKVDNQWTDQIWSYASQDKSCHLHVSCMVETLSHDFEDILVDIGRDIAKGGDRTGRKKITIKRNNKDELEIRIKAPNAKKKLEKKFRTSFLKHAQIVLGALISVLIGDPTAIIATVFINLLVAFI